MELSLNISNGNDQDTWGLFDTANMPHTSDFMYDMSLIREGIYNNVYYTLIGSNIVNEVSLQRSQALGIINNVGKYENIIKECDNILAMFENKEPTNGSQFNEEFVSFRKDVVSVLQSQQQAINLMMDSLGLNKPKENPDGK